MVSVGIVSDSLRKIYRLFEKLSQNRWNESVPKGFKLTHPIGTPISHETMRTFNLFRDCWGEVWSLSDDPLPLISLVRSGRPYWEFGLVEVPSPCLDFFILGLVVSPTIAGWLLNPFCP
jgi:hypothetical protein